MAYDLFLGVPEPSRAGGRLDSGMAVDGWIPVNPLTLETAFPGVYAVGDVAAVGTPRAGVFAEGQAAVVADRIGAQLWHGVGTAEYDGRGICYMEFGRDQVAQGRRHVRERQRTGRNDRRAGWDVDGGQGRFRHLAGAALVRPGVVRPPASVGACRPDGWKRSATASSPS